MDWDTAEEPTGKKTQVNLGSNSDVILLLSEDEEEDVCVWTEQNAEHMSSKEKPQQIQSAKPAVDEHSCGDDSGSCDLVTFIQKHCCTNIYSAHPEDLVQVVSDTPYCLYVYVGVQVGGGQSTSFVLLGYFDQNSDEHVVKLLHTLQMSVDTADPQNAAGMDTLDITNAAYSDGCLLIGALNKLKLPLSNMALFYCSAPHPVLSQLLTYQLQTYSPKLVSLCSISGMAGRACQAAFMVSFSHVVDLIRNIHHHYSTCPIVNDRLKEVFAETGSYDPLHPASAQCSFIAVSVKNIAACWQNLLEYFTSLKQTEGTDKIKTQMMDDKVKLHFLFLSHTLEPLRALHDLQQSGTANLLVELQLVFILLQSYATSILRSPAVDRFLLKRELQLLHLEEELLPVAKVIVGSRATDLMRTTHLNLGDWDRNGFLKDAQHFYKAALHSLVESIPGLLWDMTRTNVGQMLKDPKNIPVSHLQFF